MWPKDQVAEHRSPLPAEAADRTCLATITMPAAERYVAFARLATAHLCGVLGLNVSRVGDLRLAVDEACGQFLPARGDLELRFEWEPEALHIAVRGPITVGWPDRGSLGWLVLDALVGDLCCEIGTDGIGTVGFAEPLSPDEVYGDELWFAAP